MRIGIEAQRIFRKNKHGMDYVVLQEIKELQQIEQFMDTESVRDKYKPFISDPVKSIIRKTNPDYLKEHKPAFLILWVQLGLKHPGSYFSAWINFLLQFSEPHSDCCINVRRNEP